MIILRVWISISSEENTKPKVNNLIIMIKYFSKKIYRLSWRSMATQSIPKTLVQSICKGTLKQTKIHLNTKTNLCTGKEK